MMKIGANEVPQGIDDMKRKHHCLHQLSRKIPGCKIRGMYINNQYTIPPYKILIKYVQIFNIFLPIGHQVVVVIVKDLILKKRLLYNLVNQKKIMKLNKNV